MKTIEKQLEIFGQEKRKTFGLENLQKALSYLGNPQNQTSSIVIAGTNGKGSTSLFLSSILIEYGLKVHTFMSPHLQSPTERFLRNLVPIDEVILLSLIEEYLSLGRQFELSYFEFLCLLHYIYSKESDAELQILEVGLGGRLDGTNLTTPKACLLTNIGLDHCEYLGNTHIDILKEKMGVFRENVPIFTGVTQADLKTTLSNRANALGSEVHFVDSIPTVNRQDIFGQELLFKDTTLFVSNPSHATRLNVALCLTCIKHMYPDIPQSTIQKAMGRVNTPGRMEIVSEDPVVILSGDHNPDGMKQLIQSFTCLDSEAIHVLCGISPDKDYQKMIDMIEPTAKSFILTQSQQNLAKTASPYKKHEKYVENAHEGLKTLMKRAKPKEWVLVTGSLYLIGEIRSHFLPAVEFLRP